MEVHNCIHCGTETQPNWRFCRRCGTALENLDQQPVIANCSNCSSPVAEGWRFCFNCGTGTGDATAIGGSGLSSDDVAELIATPPADTMSTAATISEPVAAEPTATAAPEPAMAQESDAPEAPAKQPPDDVTLGDFPSEPETRAAEPESEPVAAAPEQPETAVRPPQLGPEADAEPTTPTEDAASRPEEPVITGMEVSFEANPDLAQDQPVRDRFESAPPSPPQFAPGGAAEAAAAPPAPPVAAESAEIAAAAHRVVQPPPAPQQQDFPDTPDVAAAATDRVAMVERTARDVTAGATPDGDEPIIHIPERAGTRPVLSEIPKPIGAARNPTDTQLPPPIGAVAATPMVEEAAAPIVEEVETAPRPRVAVPEPRPRPEPRSAENLPPIDGRSFQNPGLVGQFVQLALIVSAAVSVLMMLGLYLLNNRMDAYARDGENLIRVESAESIINMWLRPSLALVVLGTYLLFVSWVRRAVRNLSFFDRPVPEAAPWMWAIPVVNVFVLYRHVDLGWKGSDALRRSGDWRKGRPDLWNLAFFVAIIAGFGLTIYGWLLGADTFEAAIDANTFSMIGYFLVAISLLCAAKAVENVIRGQRARAESFA